VTDRDKPLPLSYHAPAASEKRARWSRMLLVVLIVVLVTGYWAVNFGPLVLSWWR
jgi:hypothetical protein